jgi:hypothetical protein
VFKVDNDLGVTKIEIDLLYITGTSISPDTTKLSIIGREIFRNRSYTKL